ncbi:hypothetical protein E4U21_005879 [Claviceps maximensis]|nr:hypothetical protein E4U21_005879 [Claviceps maximensis]
MTGTMDVESEQLQNADSLDDQNLNLIPGSRLHKRAKGHSQVSTDSEEAQLCIKASKHRNLSPKFHDGQSRVGLTQLALRELDRRNGLKDPLLRPAVPHSCTGSVTSAVSTEDEAIARFAEAGGPNLCHLRSKNLKNITHAMADVPTSASVSQLSDSSRITRASKKRSTAYDANFTADCERYNIFSSFFRLPDETRAPKPANLNDIRQALKVTRGSFSPFVASEEMFENFQFRNKTSFKGTVMRTIIPFIAGDSGIRNEGHVPFKNLASITNNTTVNPFPDFYDGAHPGAVDQEVKEALYQKIVPTVASAPIVPNFFLEAKSIEGSLAVAEKQIMLDGAHGVVGMHALQNYLLDEPAYDGNAYTFSATFVGGFLNLYAHHPEAPTEPAQNLRCYTTQLHAYALTGDYEVFLEGIGAFRNLRNLAKTYRDQFIETANARSRGRG